MPATTRTKPAKQPKDWLAIGNAVIDDIWTVYPERDVPHPFVPTRTAVIDLLKQGVYSDALVRAARNYRTHVAKEGTEPKYVIGPTRFYRDGVWQQFNVVTVRGRTRAEWARSGQDVAEFDRLAEGL
jgi:hypothetical protein